MYRWSRLPLRLSVGRGCDAYPATPNKKVLLMKKQLLSFAIFATIWIPGGVAIGQTGGLYKVAVADLTGDGIVDLALAYHAVGLVTVEQGDGQGRFKSLVPNQLAKLPLPQDAENLVCGRR